MPEAEAHQCPLQNAPLAIAKGTLPLPFWVIWLGRRHALLMLPERLAQALAPWPFGLLLASPGTRVLWVSCGQALIAMAALLSIQVPARISAPPALTRLEDTA